MQTMSLEQRAVLDYIRGGFNVAVDACAGSGKSTTILSVAKEMSGKKIRQFTYNAMLRHEVKEKIKELGLTNIQVHTYHSFAVHYYSHAAHTDTGIRQILRNNTLPRIPIPYEDIVVLDESQDMTKLYFQLIVKMSKDMMNQPNHIHKTFQLLVLGDYMQGLYEFKGADIRFLTHSDQIWSSLPYLETSQFKLCTLKTSYRITHQMAKFVNNDMLGEERLQACREGVPVVYIRRPRFQIEQIVVYQIRRLLQEGESPSDIFVLGGSVKGPNSNIRHMENTLTDHDIPCHVPMFETDAVDERVIDGKVVFSTFHTVKGRQRKYVFVVGFDQGYFYNARNIPKTVCPNTLYVGCTRATHGLYLLENDNSRPLEFLKRSQPEMKQSDYIDFKGTPQTIFHDSYSMDASDKKDSIPTYRVTPTDLIKFVSESILEEITPILDSIFIKEFDPQPEDEILIPTVIKTTRGLHEDVSDLNGIAIPAMYYDSIIDESNIDESNNKKQSGANILKQMIRSSVQDMRENAHLFLKRAAKEIPEQCITPDDYLYLANVYTAVQEKLYSKLKQIDKTEYTWITPEIIDTCKMRMCDNLGQEFQNKSTEIEKQLIHSMQEMEHSTIDLALQPHFGYEMRFRFTARADLVTESTLWEIKCTSKISLDHLMQVVIYAWIWRLVYEREDDENKKVYKILNIRTGERLRLEATTDELTQIVASLLKGKYGKQEALDDGDFVQICQDIIKKETENNEVLEEYEDEEVEYKDEEVEYEEEDN